MENNIEKQTSTEIDNLGWRYKIETLENALLNSNDTRIVKGNSDTFPLKHSFSDGIYNREILVKKGGFVIGKIHKHDHTWFLLQGEMMVGGPEGEEYFTAPYYAVAKAGTKRVVYALEDCIFVNVHPNPNNNTNIEELEEEYVCDSYNEYEKFKLLK
jgi:hypothetical protein